MPKVPRVLKETYSLKRNEFVSYNPRVFWVIRVFPRSDIKIHEEIIKRCNAVW